MVDSSRSSPARPRWLLTAATALELDSLRATWPECDLLVCGVGPTAAAATLAAYLARREQIYTGVIIGGVAGVYPKAESPGENPQYPAQLLDICLADREILGDFGIAAPHGAEPFTGPELAARHEFSLASPLLQSAAAILRRRQIPFHCGPFVTVNAATATLERGLALARRYHGLCENMEGAAAALVCRDFKLPLLEIRCISNLVADRDPSRWRLAEAIARSGEVLRELLPELVSEPPG